MTKSYIYIYIYINKYHIHISVRSVQGWKRWHHTPGLSEPRSLRLVRSACATCADSDLCPVGSGRFLPLRGSVAATFRGAGRLLL